MGDAALPCPVGQVLDAAATGARIRMIRQAAGCSTEDLCQIMAVSCPDSIRRWETGRRFPRLHNLVRLAQVFSLTVDDLAVLRQPYRSMASVQEEPACPDFPAGSGRCEPYWAGSHVQVCFRSVSAAATGARLRTLQRDRGITVHALQQMLGLKAQDRLYKWLCGMELLPAERLFELALVLHVRADDILVLSPSSA